MIRVEKRSGALEPYDFEKIQVVIDFACKGLDVDKALLTDRFDQFLFDGIKTTAIQENLIEHAKQLATPQTSDWVVVAGRLLTMNLWAERGSYKQSFYEFAETQRLLGLWKHPGFSVYTKHEYEILGNAIVKERDMDMSYASVRSAISKYLMPNECVQQMFMGEALIIASIEDPKVRVDKAIEIYNDLSTRELSLASPWLMYLRANKNIASCFIFGIGDSLDSIFHNLYNFAQISKFGGGAGAYFGFIRAHGSSLMDTPDGSKGVVPWIKIYNDVAVAVNQGGKRAGAITVALPIWHADIEAFLDMQTEAGDQRTKAYDVKPQVCIPDLFMKLKGERGVPCNNDWYMFCPHEVKEKLGYSLPDLYGDEFERVYWECVEAAKSGKLRVVKTKNAKELFKLVMKVAFETGLPYCFFTDAVNKANPNKHKGVIYCGNLCQESFSVFTPDQYIHTCNLLSVVVGRVKNEALERICNTAVRILDNGIELTDFPISQSTNHNNLYRTIGVGIQGLHDLLARENKNYYNLDWIAQWIDDFAYYCTKASVNLAKERGPYPAFEGSDWQNGIITSRYAESSYNPERWIELQKEINVSGIRNSQIISPAPNTSTSILMDAGAGVMPVYSGFFYEDNKDGNIPVVGMYLKEKPLSYALDITKYKPWVLAKFAGVIGAKIDTGASCEYVMDKNDPDFKASYLWDTIEEAHKSGSKTVYYIRTVKKGEALVANSPVCIGCVG